MCTTCGCSGSESVKIYKPCDTDEDVIFNETGMHSHDGGATWHTHDNAHTPKAVNEIAIEQDILHKNNLLAERNKGYLEAKNIYCFNLMSSPGSGKTSLLEATAYRLKDKIKMYVIEGDQQTDNDAVRMEEAGISSIQINTGTGCHLDAPMINSAIKQLAPEDHSLLFIENVGNLVCPALFNLGEHEKIVVASVTEGDDKPLKYPNIFQEAALCIINKIDLLPYVKFSVEAFKANALRVNPTLSFIELSATTGAGLDEWCNRLQSLKFKV